MTARAYDRRPGTDVRAACTRLLTQAGLPSGIGRQSMSPCDGWAGERGLGSCQGGAHPAAHAGRFAKRYRTAINESLRRMGGGAGPGIMSGRRVWAIYRIQERNRLSATAEHAAFIMLSRHAGAGRMMTPPLDQKVCHPTKKKAGVVCQHHGLASTIRSPSAAWVRLEGRAPQRSVCQKPLERSIYLRWNRNCNIFTRVGWR